MSNANKGFNVTKLDFLPSEFHYYDFNKLRLMDLSLSQVTNLSISGNEDLSKLIEIYAPSFGELTPDQVSNLLYIDFIASVHYINHLTFGIYNNSFSRVCDECEKKSRVEYNLYNLNFKAGKAKPDKVKYENIEVTLNNFTVDLMAKLVGEGLEKDKNAFIAICINKATIDGVEIDDFANFEKAKESLGNYPYRFKEFLTKEIKERYPQILPIDTFLSCGHKFSFTPDLTLKGLPKIATS